MKRSTVTVRLRNYIASLAVLGVFVSTGGCDSSQPQTGDAFTLRDGSPSAQQAPVVITADEFRAGSSFLQELQQRIAESGVLHEATEEWAASKKLSDGELSFSLSDLGLDIPSRVEVRPNAASKFEGNDESERYEMKLERYRPWKTGDKSASKKKRKLVALDPDAFPADDPTWPLTLEAQDAATGEKVSVTIAEQGAPVEGADLFFLTPQISPTAEQLARLSPPDVETEDEPIGTITKQDLYVGLFSLRIASQAVEESGGWEIQAHGNYSYYQSYYRNEPWAVFGPTSHPIPGADQRRYTGLPDVNNGLTTYRFRVRDENGRNYDSFPIIGLSDATVSEYVLTEDDNDFDSFRRKEVERNGDLRLWIERIGTINFSTGSPRRVDRNAVVETRSGDGLFVNIISDDFVQDGQLTGLTPTSFRRAMGSAQTRVFTGTLGTRFELGTTFRDR